jgi:hydrogenase large subunit
VHERLKHFVNGGQLGIFTNGYWGHPAMKLSPEVNLLAVAHYLQALEVQRKANKIVSILGARRRTSRTSPSAASPTRPPTRRRC